MIYIVRLAIILSVGYGAPDSGDACAGALRDRSFE